MLTFRSSTIAFGVVHLSILALWVAGLCPLWPLAFSAATQRGLIAWGSMDPRMGFFVTHRTHGVPRTLALTFDDGPHPENTPKLLDALLEQNVKATFFVIGRNVQRHPGIARRMVDEGHTVGIHTHDHPWNWGFIGRAKVLAQITMCADAIEQATGTRPHLFRPPFGVTNPTIANALKLAKVEPVAWDLRTFDTNARTSEQVMARISSRISQSSIVLMHDTMPFAAALARSIVERARAEGMVLAKLCIAPNTD